MLFRVDAGEVIARALRAPCSRSSENLVWKSAWDQYSAEQQAALQASVEQKLFDRVAVYLSNMNLQKP